MVRFGFQPCLSKRRQRARLFQQRDRAGERIFRAVHPARRDGCRG